MKIRTGVLGLIGALALLPSVSRADWFRQQSIMTQVGQQIAAVCGSVNTYCIGMQYYNAGAFYWSMAASKENEQCYLYPIDTCAERDEWAEDYRQVSYECAYWASYFGYEP